MTPGRGIGARAGAVWARLAAVLAAYRAGIVLLLVAVLVPLALFGEIAREVFRDDGYAWDRPVLELARSLHHPMLDVVMVVITTLGSLWVMVPAGVGVLAWLTRRGRVGAAAFYVIAFAGAALINGIAKLAFERDRPSLWDAIVSVGGYSFPSGHAMGAMAFAGATIVVAWQTRWRWWVVAGGLLFALLVGLSRVYLGVHFLTDVVAGWLASLAWVTGVYLLFAWKGSLEPLWNTGKRPSSSSPKAALDEDVNGERDPGPPGQAQHTVERSR